MTSDEQTLYQVLDLHPRATAEEVRSAYIRALEMYGPESIAVYTLVDEAQVEALRERLAEAAEVLLDPARRAGYDRSLGLAPPTTLWAEDEEDDDPDVVQAAGPGVHPREPTLTPVPAPPPEASVPPARELAHETPRQRTLPLDISEEPIRIVKAAREEPPTVVEVAGAHLAKEPTLEAPAPVAASEPERAPLLAKDWAAAVEPPSVPAEPSTSDGEPASSPPPTRVPAGKSRSSGRNLPPPLPRASSFGLRTRLGRVAGQNGSVAASAPPAPDVLSGSPSITADVPATGPSSRSNDSDSELPGRPREGRARLDIPPDAEFNGELLRQVREATGLSLQQVAERTRITRIHLENVEADRYDHLPATVYLRGILVNLARELRLDPARVSKSYLLAASRGMPRGL
jgi:hypothetical protein